LDEYGLVKFSGNPDFDSVEEAIETLPVFTEKKVVLLNDFDAEKLDADMLDNIIKLFSDIPEYCMVIVNITGFEPSVNAKTKKLTAAADEHGTVCEFALMSKYEAVNYITWKASGLGCTIERSAAEELYDITLGNLTLINTEVEKLASYVGSGGEISRQTVNILTPRMTEIRTYELANALTSKNAKTAFRILDDLVAQSERAENILGSLSGTFLDFYRAKLGKTYNQSPPKVAADFNYPKNRAFLMGKVPSSDLAYIRKCISLLFKANIRLRSLDERTVIEKTMTEILLLS
jgi:DNA polymerase-3 subunit delta